MTRANQRNSKTSREEVSGHERRLHTSKLGVAAASATVLGVAAGMAAMAPPALAYNYNHEYCAVSLGYHGACPPNGVGVYWEHLQENDASAAHGLVDVCVDEYLDPSGTGYYTGSTCAPFGGIPAQYPGGTYGYPRAWNDSGGTYVVYAAEYWN